MYHYVRPISGSKFHLLKGLELEKFKKQLDYLEDKYTIVSTEEVIDSSRNHKKLPRNACWLTFDDGYKDHYEYVLPELLKRGLKGAFFPPRNAIEKPVILDVNAIHHILCQEKNIKSLINSLNEECLQAGMKFDQINLLYRENSIPSRYDDSDTIYFKRMLQHLLPDEIRSLIVSNLFKKYVGISRKNFSNQLYMSKKELSDLIKAGMYVGSHGSNHNWLSKLSAVEQKKDIYDSLIFLDEIGAPIINWVMCYPYGDFNAETLSIIKDMGASIGITTESRVANLTYDDNLKLPRFDTNDFPQ